jgi:hypothetical protein
LPIWIRFWAVQVSTVSLHGIWTSILFSFFKSKRILSDKSLLALLLLLRRVADRPGPMVLKLVLVLMWWRGLRVVVVVVTVGWNW